MGLRVRSKLYPHKDIHKETIISPGIKNRIDPVITDLTIDNIIKIVRSYAGVTVEPGHFLVKAKIKIKTEKLN